MEGRGGRLKINRKEQTMACDPKAGCTIHESLTASAEQKNVFIRNFKCGNLANFDQFEDTFRGI